MSAVCSGDLSARNVCISCPGRIMLSSSTSACSLMQLIRLSSRAFEVALTTDGMRHTAMMSQQHAAQHYQLSISCFGNTKQTKSALL